MAIRYFTGSFTRSIDEKHRLQIPKEIQRVVAAVQGESRNMFVVLGPEPDSLALYTEAGFEELGEKAFQHLSLKGTDETRRFKREFFSQAHLVTADGQWRLILPEPLRTRAKLTGEVNLLGAWDYVLVHTEQSLKAARDGHMTRDDWPDWSGFLPLSSSQKGA